MNLWENINFATWEEMCTIELVLLLTCHSFGLGEKCCLPPRLVQDVERVVNLRVRRGERPQAADGADDGHVLVHQRRHALAVQVAAVAVITCRGGEMLLVSVCLIYLFRSILQLGVPRRELAAAEQPDLRGQEALSRNTFFKL